jgi:signal transduction histidine kinase
VPETLPKFTPDVEQGIYRVAQEAIENIVRHARAHHMQVGWEQTDGKALLSISDDGCGFDLVKVDGIRHFGLSGMSERASMLGAELELKSQSGQGTNIHLSLPIEEG